MTKGKVDFIGVCSFGGLTIMWEPGNFRYISRDGLGPFHYYCTPFNPPSIEKYEAVLPKEYAL